MKRKTGKVVTSTHEESEVLCDLCGLDVDRDNDRLTRNECTIECLVGEVYDGSDDRAAYTLDCCHVCFFTKVKPVIEALGVKIQEHVYASDRW
jgi:hypothetical protein